MSDTSKKLRFSQSVRRGIVDMMDSGCFEKQIFEGLSDSRMKNIENAMAFFKQTRDDQVAEDAESNEKVEIPPVVAAQSEAV